jgi:hypothetical protein
MTRADVAYLTTRRFAELVDARSLLHHFGDDMTCLGCGIGFWRLQELAKPKKCPTPHHSVPGLD